MEISNTETEIIQTLKDKLNIGLDEAKDIFGSIKDKLPDSIDQEDLLNIIKTFVTKNPVKSLFIALIVGVVLTKLLQKSS